MELVTAAELQELGFKPGKKPGVWLSVNPDVEIDLSKTEPVVIVGDEWEVYAPRFFGVRTRDEVATLLRLIGTQPK